MKIDLIGQALDEIKEEDQNNLNKLESKVKELESECSSKDHAVDELNREYRRLEELDHLKSDTLKYIHMILPIVEIPLGFLIGVYAFSVFFSSSMAVVLLLLAAVCEIDATNTLVEKYPKILSGNNREFKSYIQAFKRLFLSKGVIRASMVNTYSMLLDARNEAFAHSNRLLEARDEASILRRELLHLEGYIRSIEYIIEKQYFEELKDNTDIVQFINKKRDLKKVVSD